MAQNLERPSGIEPELTGWKPVVLPTDTLAAQLLGAAVCILPSAISHDRSAAFVMMVAGADLRLGRQELNLLNPLWADANTNFATPSRLAIQV